MQIMLLRTSSYNEDFILEGYATDDNGLRQLVRNYIVDDVLYLYDEEPQLDIQIEIDHKTQRISARYRNYDFDDETIFYITYINPVTL